MAVDVEPALAGDLPEFDEAPATPWGLASGVVGGAPSSPLTTTPEGVARNTGRRKARSEQLRES